jgi:hypothetical protein
MLDSSGRINQIGTPEPFTPSETVAQDFPDRPGSDARLTAKPLIASALLLGPARND